MGASTTAPPTLFAVIEGFADQPTHREYVICSSHGGVSYVVQRRFSEFVALHAKLSSKWTATNPYCNSADSHGFGTVLPASFPVARLLIHTATSLDERMKALQLYVRGLLGSIDAAKGDLPPADLLEFLGAEALL